MNFRQKEHAKSSYVELCSNEGNSFLGYNHKKYGFQLETFLSRETRTFFFLFRPDAKL